MTDIVKYQTVLEVKQGRQTLKRIICTGSADACTVALNAYYDANGPGDNDKLYVEKVVIKQIQETTNDGKQILMES